MRYIVIVLLTLFGGIAMFGAPDAIAGDNEDYFENFSTELQRENAGAKTSDNRSSWWRSLVGGVFDTAFDSGVYETGAGDFESGGAAGIGRVLRQVVNTFIAILGVIATILFIYSGYLWMTAGGDDSQIEKAKSIMKQVVVGFIVLSLSYGIVSFIFAQVQKAGPGTPQAAPAARPL